MPFPPGTLIFDLVTKTPRGRRRNRMYYENDGGGVPNTVARLRAFANLVMTTWAPLMRPLMSADAVIEKVEAYAYNVGGPEVEALSTIAAVEGEIPTSVGFEGEANDLLPDEVSLMVQVRTGIIGRANRGRRFFCGLSEKVNTNGVITDTTYRDAAKDLANQLPTTIESESLDIPDEDPVSVALAARHYNRKTNALLPISQAFAVETLASRRDRRQPLEFERIP